MNHEDLQLILMIIYSGCLFWFILAERCRLVWLSSSLGGFFRFHWLSLPIVTLLAMAYRFFQRDLSLAVVLLGPHFAMIFTLLLITYFSLSCPLKER